MYSVISVIDKRLPGNTKKWTLVRSWLIRVRLVHSWADTQSVRYMMQYLSLSPSLSLPLFLSFFFTYPRTLQLGGVIQTCVRQMVQHLSLFSSLFLSLSHTHTLSLQ